VTQGRSSSIYFNPHITKRATGSEPRFGIRGGEKGGTRNTRKKWANEPEKGRGKGEKKNKKKTGGRWLVHEKSDSLLPRGQN